MKVLLVLACILWLGADADHIPEHNLRGSPFVPGRSHRYELTLNMTAGVPGMSSQVAKSVMQMDVIIRSKSENEYLLKVEHVKASEPEKGAESPDAYVPLRRSAELERDLNKPIKFTYKDGEIKSYTLGESESLESRSIKRGILRHFETKLEATRKSHPRIDSEERLPITLNVTERDEMGTYDVYYLITSSPYPWFPYEKSVYNISKTMNYEEYGYPSIHEHHNFASQGYPEVCRKEKDSLNRYGAGCPIGYEPHQTPMKASKNMHYNLRLLHGKMIFETIFVNEKNIAILYDQDMVVNVEAKYELREVSDRRIEEPQEHQKEYTELNTYPSQEELKKKHPSGTDDLPWELEFVYGIFDNIRSSELVAHAEKAWQKIAETVVAADTHGERAQEIGRDIVHLQEMLALMKKSHFDTLWRKVADLQGLKRAPELEKVKRQILLDVIPLVGTGEAVQFIKYLITEKKVSVWEAKEILEALPANIIEANEEHIKEIWELTALPQVKRYHVLHSATYLTLAKVIREACIEPEITDNEDDIDEPWSGNDERYESRRSRPSYRSRSEDDDDDDDDDTPYGDQDYKHSSFRSKSHKMHHSSHHSSRSESSPRCSKEIVQRFIREVSSKMQSATQMQEKIIYLQALVHVGHEKALKILKPYAYGDARDIQEYTPEDIDFIKTVTLYALHGTAIYYPRELLRLVAPIFFNKTEATRVRIAAFSVSIRCQPTLAYLQHVARDSHFEPSQEVGSYVYSTLVNYGNGSIPYMQPTASKIRLIISQTKEFDIGNQYSKSVVQTFYDELRNFGIEHKSAIVKNNESAIPSAIYGSMGYNLESLRDTFYKFAMNIQGLDVEDVIQAFDMELLGLKMPRDIPSNKENEIFGTLKLLNRMPKELRITIYKKIFYADSYHFFDSESLKTYLIPLLDYLRDYFNMERGSVSGHFVKVFIPSSFHSVSYTGISFPVVTTIKHPLVLSFKVEAKRQGRHSPLEISHYIRPSFYYTTYYSSALINTVDNYAYGVYHEQVFIGSLPVELDISVDEPSNTLEISYKLPEVPKKIYRRRSEAGTYVDELKWSTIGKYTEDREPITTIPVLFQREKVISTVGLPPLRISVYTEDIQDQYYDVPQNLEDVVQLVVEELRNAGWRRKEVNATIVSSSRASVDKVMFRISYNKTHKMESVSQRQGLHSSDRESHRFPFSHSDKESDRSRRQHEEHNTPQYDSDDERSGRQYEEHETPQYDDSDRFQRRRYDDESFRSRRPSYDDDDDDDDSGSDNYRRQYDEGSRRFLSSRNDDDDDQSYSHEDAEKVAQIFSKIRDPSESSLSSSDAERIYEIVSRKLPKVAHEFYFGVETSPSVHTAELRIEYNHTYDRSIQTLLAYVEARTPERRSPIKVCLGHVMQYMNRPNEFHYNTRYYQDSVAPFYTGVSYGDNCKFFEQPDIVATGGFSNVPYEKLFSREEFSEKPGRDAFVPATHDECLNDVREGKSQSEACLAAVEEEAEYNRYYVKINWKKDLPSALLNVSYKLEDAFKYYFYSQVDINRVNVNNPPKTLEITANYINKLTDESVVDIYVKKPQEEMIYHKISLDYLEPASSLYTVPEMFIKSYTNNTYEPSCALMENYIRTYDLKTYPLPKDSCTYVLSTHCTEKKKFAVLAKQDPSSREAKEVIVYVADHKVILKPSESKRYYTIIYNDRPLEVRQPLYLDEESLLHVYTVTVKDDKVNSILVLHADRAGIKIEYDGKNVKVHINPLYKGQLCGLCSEFDGEIAREYRGPNQCWYYDSEDFAHSSVVDHDKCGIPSNPKYPVLCPSGEYNMINRGFFQHSHEYTSTNPSYRGRDQDDDDDDDDNSYRRGSTSSPDEPEERTAYVQRREFVCFSTQPVPICEEGYQAEREYSVSVDFHCLPRYDATTRRLVAESKTRVLRELAAKKVDFSDSVKAAASCSSNN